MKRLLLITLLSYCLGSYAQVGVTYKVDTVCHMPPGNVYVAVEASNLNPLTSFSLSFTYDLSVLDFTGNVLLNPDLVGGFFVVHESTNFVIDVGYFALDPVTLSDPDTIFSLEFTHLVGSGYVDFVPDTFNTYINGMVTLGPVFITQQPDTIGVLDGSLAYFQVATSLASGNLCQWQESPEGGINWQNLSNSSPYTGTNTPLLMIDTASLAMNGYLYRCKILNCGGIYTDAALLQVYGNASLSGYLTYLNDINSPINNTAISFWNNGNLVYTITTDVNGFFELPFMVADTYDISVNCLKPWGGGNAVDGLMILKHFTGLIILSGLPLQSADVDFSGAVNAVDALMVIKRFVGMINSFPNGDWVFDTSQVIVLENQANFIEIKGLCTGDVDGSHTP